MRPTCTLNLEANPHLPEKPCGRVMIEMGTTEQKGLTVYGCPRCDKSLNMRNLGVAS